MAPKPEAVPFPVALDKFGIELKNEMIKLQKDGVLKSALMTDLAKLYGAMFWMQQLFATFYNAHIADYTYFEKGYEEIKKKVEDLETRIAGYSERINGLPAEILKKVQENQIDNLIKELQENGKLREAIKQAIV